MFLVKIDFTKMKTFLINKKLPIFLFISSVGTFFLFNFNYVMIVKRYELFFINFAFGLVAYLTYDVIIGKKLYYTKLNINQTENRKDEQISNNIKSKKRKNDTE